MSAALLPLTLAVTGLRAEAPGIRTLEFGAEGGQELLSFVPGSHVFIECAPAGEPAQVNAYSLIGSGLRPVTYAVTVRQGDGVGSRWLHQLRVGDQVRLSAPRSHFAPVLRARRHLLIAGGIGITPLLSHVEAAVAWQRPFELIYGHRPEQAVHAERLRSTCGQLMSEFTDRRSLQAAVVAALSRQPLGTHLYVCGPLGLQTFATEQAALAGWLPQRVHLERFTPADLDPGRFFRARLARTGLVVDVPAGTSLLDALLAAEVDVDSLCRRGVCGECRVPLLTGRPDHRDSVLSDAERAHGTHLMACVSRSLDAELVLDR